MAFKLADLFVEVSARTEGVSRKLDGLRHKLDELASRRFDIGGGFTAALGIGAGLLAIKGAIAGASDLAEELSATEQTFGKSADKVKAFGDQMARSFGLPKREMLAAANNLGAIFIGAGIAEGKAAELSVTVSKLAADLSSFKNVPVAEALEKLRAGLTGESEPLKAFGVLMNDDMVKARALAMGLNRAGKELSEESKVMARLAIIQDKTVKASGDLERTAGGAANQFRKFAGSLTNLADTMGAVLLPAATQLALVLNEVATDLQTSATDGVGAWSAALTGLTAGIETIGIIYRNLGDIFARTGTMIGGALLNAWEYLSYGGQVAGAVGSYIAAMFLDTFAAVVEAGLNMKDNLVAILGEIWAYIKSGFTDPIEFKMKPILDGVQLKDIQLALPELKLSSVQNQIDEIDKRMDDRAQERAGKQLAAAQAAGKAAAGPAAAAAAKAPGKADKNMVTDLDAYSKDLQEAALNAGGDKEDKVVKAVEAGNKIQAEILDATKKNAGKPGPAKFG